jgi:hypothetical protein
MSPNYMPTKAQTAVRGIFLTHSQPGTRRRVVRTRLWRLHPTWKTGYVLYVGSVVPRVDLDGTESLAPSGFRPPDSFIPRKTLRIRHGLFQLCHFTSESLIIPYFDSVYLTNLTDNISTNEYISIKILYGWTSNGSFLTWYIWSTLN